MVLEGQVHVKVAQHVACHGRLPVQTHARVTHALREDDEALADEPGGKVDGEDEPRKQRNANDVHPLLLVVCRGEGE